MTAVLLYMQSGAAIRFESESGGNGGPIINYVHTVTVTTDRVTSNARYSKSRYCEA